MATKLAPSVEDILALPDDGYRHELIDGVHHVSPAPGSRHQRALGELFFRLRAGCPPAFTVLMAPFAWVIADPSGARHEVQPDLLVIASGPDRDRLEDEVPALVVEILSPGAANRARDLEDKFALYEADAGESFVVTRNGVPVGELGPSERSRFVARDRVLQLFPGAPPIDAAQFRADVDNWVDQNPAPRA